MLTKKKAEGFIVAVRAAAIMGELDAKRIRQICRRLKVGATVVTNAAIGAGILAKPKRGVYFFRKIDMNPTPTQVDEFIGRANVEYRKKALAERDRKEKAEPIQRATDPEPPAPELTFEQLAERLERLERAVVEIATGKKPFSQLELIQGGGQ